MITVRSRGCHFLGSVEAQNFAPFADTPAHAFQIAGITSLLGLFDAGFKPFTIGFRNLFGCCGLPVLLAVFPSGPIISFEVVDLGQFLSFLFIKIHQGRSQPFLADAPEVIPYLLPGQAQLGTNLSLGGAA